MGSIDHRSLPLQPSGKQNADMRREVQSLPCELNVADVKRSSRRVRECLKDMVPQIAGIQGALRDAVTADRCTNEDDPCGNEDATKRLRKRKRSMQAASGPHSNSDPKREVSQSRISASRYSGLSGKHEQTETIKVEDDKEQLASNETDLLYGGLAQNEGNEAPPSSDDVAVSATKAPKRLVIDENRKQDATTGEDTALNKPEIHDSINRNVVSEEGLCRVNERTRSTSQHATVTQNRCQEGESSERDGGRGERHNASHDCYELPRPLSSRPPTQNQRPLQHFAGEHDKKTGKDLESTARPRPGKDSSHSYLKNTKDTKKPFIGPDVGTFENGAKLGNANEVASLDSIPSLDSVNPPSLDSCTDSSWPSTGESSIGQTDNDRDQTIPKRLNSTPEATLQNTARTCSDEDNVLQALEETGTSALHSNDNAASFGASEELDFRSDPPSRAVQHEGEFVTLHSETQGQAVADRGQASDIREQSKCILVFNSCLFISYKLYTFN